MSVPAVAIFDAYGTLLDVHSAARRLATTLGPAVDGVSELWRQKQLEYSWTRGLMGRYADFWQVTEQALDYALAARGLNDPTLRGALLESYRKLAPYPDVRPALIGYRELGVRVAVFSNATPAMLQNALAASQLEDLIDAVYSTDALKRYKPDMRVYAGAGEALHAPPEVVAFHSSNAWDAAGAASFGWRTFWINRAHRVPEYTWAGLRECADLQAALAAAAATP